MLLKDKSTGDLILIEDVEQLANPLNPVVMGRNQAGQEEQEPKKYSKDQLAFLSGEALPRCWVERDSSSDVPLSMTKASKR